MTNLFSLASLGRILMDVAPDPFFGGPYAVPPAFALLGVLLLLLALGLFVLLLAVVLILVAVSANKKKKEQVNNPPSRKA